MKRIAIFIDGTWNRPDAQHPTNVLRLSRCVHHYDRKTNVPQYVIYTAGVGSGEGSTWLARKLDRWFGGGFGWGSLALMENVYRRLVYAYEPGDEVYVFGFSRGAFAARSLVGLIRSCGIAPRSHLDRIPEAVARYVDRSGATHPEDPSSYEFRESFAPYTATSDKEFKWRRERGNTEAIRLYVDYVGVWDTVSALGVPKWAPFAKSFNQKYEFHDAELSSSVLSARHAISLDERRSSFPAHPWSNLDRLNEPTLSAKGPKQRKPFLQQWFPGNHGSVGGGGRRIGLSSITMHWIAQGAVDAGLSISWEDFDRQAWRFSVLEKLDNKFGPVGAVNWVLQQSKKDREGPSDIENLSLAAVDRFQLDDEYRPKSLDQIYHELYDLSEAEWGDLRGQMIARDGGPTHDLDDGLRPRD
ncbi:Uncharacterized protein, PA2063/DUF2235 family [Cognatiyoonia sediminum]|uniref:Uncharacterized protein, PA2063/DUF2235 family n=1 Tax=Cognatiyoonia sediminum TaxID=1508389 RepID=A0A1M5MR63_9RHOB|nr:DUF2235 domain-containing protein [Cognatiyoonia sediminum]SHG79369.1 Uncharacterized protein, PA2063/DUF2235 family [Cognatiyoonia sediminum]